MTPNSQFKTPTSRLKFTLPDSQLYDYLCHMSQQDDMSGFSQRSKLDPEDYYMSDEGWIVFTEKYLLKRGYCCKSGCKHCPYGFNKKTGRIEGKN